MRHSFVRWVVPGLILSLAVLFGIAVPAQAAGPTEISLSASAGPAGSSVTVTGSGFARQSPGTLTAGTNSVPITTSATGSFSASVTIPPTSAANVVVTAKTGSRSASASYAVTYSPASTTAGKDGALAVAEAPVTMAARTKTGTTTATTAPPISSDSLRFGVSTPGGPWAASELDAVATLVNESPSIVMS